MSLRDVYRAFGEDSEEGELARRLLEQQHWFTTLADFDPKTGEALPLGLDEVLRRLSSRRELTVIHDRLRRIVDHSRVAVAHLLGSLSESPRREQAMLPVRSVRELNATSFIALNRRPGRNMREKLAGKPYMQAVRRYQSIDLPENRLLRAFASQLVEFLELRQQYLHEEDELLSVLRSWLHCEEAASIGRWENLPPNNTLLSHREYRRVWDAWRWLQNLDDDIDRDMTRLDERTAVVTVWEDRAKKFKSGTVLYGDMPVVLDFEQFEIRPWIDRLPTKPTPPLRRPKPICETSSVCIDITEPRPTYATTEASAATVNDLYLWQRWRRDVEMVDIDLYEADFPMLHPDATTVAMPDLLFRRDQEPALADAASRSFARRLRRTFDSPSLTWLLPDHLNEFQVEVLRRNLNASFPKSEPLPRSVAAVFAAVGYKEIKRDGYAVMVVDQVGGVTTATRLVARIDSELARQVPETKGYYWERTPTSVLERSPDGYDALLTVSHVGADGQWRQRSTRPSAPESLTKTSAREQTSGTSTNSSVLPLHLSAAVPVYINCDPTRAPWRCGETRSRNCPSRSSRTTDTSRSTSLGKRRPSARCVERRWTSQCGMSSPSLPVSLTSSSPSSRAATHPTSDMKRASTLLPSRLCMTLRADSG